jgi:hypothetical protein
MDAQIGCERTAVSIGSLTDGVKEPLRVRSLSLMLTHEAGGSDRWPDPNPDPDPDPGSDPEPFADSAPDEWIVVRRE